MYRTHAPTLSGDNRHTLAGIILDKIREADFSLYFSLGRKM
jgi:hypothetical protein